MTIKEAFTLYKGYNDKCYKIVTTEVRETDRKYISKNRTGLAFGCKASFDKYELCFTIGDAIRSKLNHLEEEKKSILQRLQTVEIDIEQIKQMEIRQCDCGGNITKSTKHLYQEDGIWECDKCGWRGT
jgi:predicted RNA-binding Zn-ribbon protein involved in translation (DUF1610 family)